MKKLVFSFVLFAAVALATPVGYTTAGSFASTSSNSVTNGSAKITFDGNTALINAPSFSSLGTFVVTGSVGGTFSDSFTLTIAQTIPSSGTGTSSTTVNGTITGNSSTISLAFVPSSVNIGTVNYSFSPDDYGLNNPEVNSGDTTIQAFITVPTPEPAYLGLVGAALLGLGFVKRRIGTKK